MPIGEYQPRLSVDITEDQQRKLQDLIPHGFRKALIHLFIDDFIAYAETLTPKQRDNLLMLLTMKNLRIRDILTYPKEVEGG